MVPDEPHYQETSGVGFSPVRDESSQEHRDKLDTMAKTLLEKENIDENDIKAIFGPRVAEQQG
jgi:ATP-dependent Zn protease